MEKPKKFSLNAKLFRKEGKKLLFLFECKKYSEKKEKNICFSLNAKLFRKEGKKLLFLFECKKIFRKEGKKHLFLFECKKYSEKKEKKAATITCILITIGTLFLMLLHIKCWEPTSLTFYIPDRFHFPVQIGHFTQFKVKTIIFSPIFFVGIK
jgi:hypothetical protein